MMKKILILTITLSILSSVLAYSICPSGGKNPSNGGCYGTNCECAQGVQYACSLDRVNMWDTSSWIRGSNIADICRSGQGNIYKNASIATFFGPRNTYKTADNSNQHAAIFLSCSGNSGSINVNDQWNAKGRWGPRKIFYRDARLRNVDNSRYFYLIEK